LYFAVSETNVASISAILAEDMEAIQNKYIVYGSLHLPVPELKELDKKMIANPTYGAKAYFSDILSMYRSNHPSDASVKTLIYVFSQLQLNGVVG